FGYWPHAGPCFSCAQPDSSFLCQLPESSGCEILHSGHSRTRPSTADSETRSFSQGCSMRNEEPLSSLRFNIVGRARTRNRRLKNRRQVRVRSSDIFTPKRRCSSCENPSLRSRLITEQSDVSCRRAALYFCLDDCAGNFRYQRLRDRLSFSILPPYSQ